MPTLFYKIYRLFCTKKFYLTCFTLKTPAKVSLSSIYDDKFCNLLVWIFVRVKMKNSENKSKVSIGAKLLAFFFTLIIGSFFVAYEVMKNNGNETSAAQSINTIKTLQIGYASKHQGKFAPNFDELIKSAQLDERFAGESPIVNGYVFKMTVQEPSGTKPAFYSINADPQTVYYFFKTGTRHFYFDSTLATTKSTEEDRPAKADDPTL